MAMNGQPGQPFDWQQMFAQQAGPGIPGMQGGMQPPGLGGGTPPGLGGAMGQGPGPSAGPPQGIGGGGPPAFPPQQPAPGSMGPGPSAGPPPPMGGDPNVAGQGQIPGGPEAMQQAKGPNQDQLMLDYLTTMGGLQPKQAEIARKRSMVDQLRKGGQMSGMRQTGNMFHAQNPLEGLSALAHSGVGAWKANEADKDQAGYNAASDQAFADLRKRSGVGQP